MLAFTIAVAITMLMTTVASPAREACVKYHKCISVDRLDCKAETRSSNVQEICYAASQRYAVVWLGKPQRAVPYHYCEIPQNVIDEWRQAPSMGRYYREHIRSSSNNGLYDCRKHPIPEL